MKRIIALLLVSALSLGLCACGTTSNTSTTPYIPPVQSEYTPPVDNIPIVTPTNTGPKLDFITDEATAPEIWRKAYGYLCASEGVEISITANNKGQGHATLELNNQTGEYHLQLEESSTYFDSATTIDIFTARGEDSHYYCYTMTTEKNDGVTRVDPEAYQYGEMVNELDQNLRKALNFLAKIEHLLERKGQASVKGADCAKLEGLIEGESDVDYIVLYVNSATSHLVKMEIFQNEKLLFTTIFDYEPVTIELPAILQELASEYNKNIQAEYPDNFFYQSPYEYQGANSVGLEIQGHKIRVGEKASFVNVLDYETNLRYRISAKKKVKALNYESIDIPPLDKIEPGVNLSYSITYIKDNEEYYYSCSVENTTNETLPITECEIVLIFQDKFMTQHGGKTLEDVNIQDLVTILGSNYRQDALGLEVLLEENILFVWEYPQSVALMTRTVGTDFGSVNDGIFALSRKYCNTLLESLQEMLPQPADISTTKTFTVDNNEFIVGETRIKNIKGELTAATTWDVLTGSSIYRYYYETDTTKAYFGTASEDTNSPLCYYKIVASTDFTMSNGLTTADKPEIYTMVLGEPTDQLKDTNSNTLTYLWSGDGDPYSIQVTFLFNKNNDFVRVSEIEVIDYAPLIGQELQNTWGQYLLEGLLGLGQ